MSRRGRTNAPDPKMAFLLFLFSDVSAAALRYCLFGYPKKYFMPSFSEEKREKKRLGTGGEVQKASSSLTSV